MDDNRPILERLAASAANWPRPLINSPRLIARLTRDGFAKLMQGAPGVVVPPVRRIDRNDLRMSDRSAASGAAVAEFDYPIIARPVGSHAGEGLKKINGASDLERYLNEVECDHYYIAPFVDYSNADGLFRKCRIVLIEGAPFAVHMAISHDWIVHYLNADMTNNEANRRQEAAFMEAFETDFALRHVEAFRAVCQRTGLDYVLLDCAETATGDLLIFEAGTAMIVHALDPVDIFPYKPRNMEKIFAAFEIDAATESGRDPRFPEVSSVKSGHGGGRTNQGGVVTRESELDPDDWDAFRTQARAALDGMIDHLSTLRERPVWVVAPPEIRGCVERNLPEEGRSLNEALEEFDRTIKPYATGNGHPGSWAGCMERARLWEWLRKCSPPASTPIAADAITSASRWSDKSHGGCGRPLAFPKRLPGSLSPGRRSPISSR